MPQRPTPPPDPRRQLRQQWLAHAAAAFDRMFAPEHQDQLVTFTQREDRACDLGKELAAFLLEQHAAADPQVRPAPDALPACPKCGQAGQRVTVDDHALPQRQLTTRAGEVVLQREQWRCTTCRVVFFPLGPETATGHRGLQPAGPPEGRASGGQGAVLQGS